MKLKLYISIFFLLVIFKIQAQEIITPLNYNPVLQDYKPDMQHKQVSKNKAALYLPFYDDFSYYYKSYFPDASLWLDSFAYVNGNFPKNPPTLGVATLDAIDQFGKIYSFASSSPFIADYLTSKEIRLDQTSNGVQLDTSSNVWFSFWYQPQGNGNNPNKDDSLILEFRTGLIPVLIPIDTIPVFQDTIHLYDSIVYDTNYVVRWKRVWASEGMTYESFKNKYGKDFRMVMIPLKDTAYFKPNFQFRFKSYASVANTYQPGWSSNVDHWNIDYVYLNHGRNQNDTTIEDVAFLQIAPTVLSNYRQVPWKHFKANPSAFQKSSMDYPFFNLSAPSSPPKNISLTYSINDLSNGTPQSIFTHNGGSNNHPPQTQMNYSLSLPTLTSSTTNDTAVFELKSNVATSPDFNTGNNSFVFYQRFYNYYAWDDGSPEFGYGINVKNGKVAIRYNTIKPDTLRAVQFFFNRTRQPDEVIDRKYFYLTVWKSLNPEIILYQKAGYTPEFNDSLNKFRTYYIDTLLILTDSFYIGWKQYNTEYLNIGFDANTNSRNITKFNIFGNWETSLYEGTIMLRPVFGAVLPSNPDNLSRTATFNCYPNPTSGKLFLETAEPNHERLTIYITDYTGREVLRRPYADEIDISSLKEGLYLVNVYNNYSGQTFSVKLMKTESN